MPTDVPSSILSGPYQQFLTQLLSSFFSAFFICGISRIVALGGVHALRMLSGISVSPLWFFCLVQLWYAPGLSFGRLVPDCWTLLTSDGPGSRLVIFDLLDALERAFYLAEYIVLCAFWYNAGLVVAFLRNYILLFTSAGCLFIAIVVIVARTDPNLLLQALPMSLVFAVNILRKSLDMVHWPAQAIENSILQSMLKDGRRLHDSGAHHEYWYRPLRPDQKEIRLLRIEKDMWLSKPRCKILDVPLHQAPRYEAISYTWDGQTPDRYIELGSGQYVCVTWNVSRIICQRATSRTIRHLWIDQVCINQAADDEKEEQVKIMGDIYRNAERVLVWLENNHTKPSQAFRLLLHLQQIPLYIANFEAYKEKLQKGEVFAAPKENWLAFANFFSHSYWSRTWIIQEMSLGRRVHLVYGRFYWDPHHIFEIPLLNEAAFRLMAVWEMGMRHGLDPMGLLHGANRFYTIMHARHNVQDGSLMSLGEALQNTQEFMASDKRDKLYALRALITSPEDVSPDYKISVREAYLRIAETLVASEPEVIFDRAGLCFARTVDGLPSWVPDWSLLPLSTYESRQGYLDESRRYAAGGSQGARESVLRLSATRLSLHCIVMSHIQRLGPPWPWSAADGMLTRAAELAIMVPFLQQAVPFLAGDAPEDTMPQMTPATVDAVWRTLFCGRVHVGTLLLFPAPASCARLFAAFLGEIPHLQRALHEQLPDGQLFSDPEVEELCMSFILEMSLALVGQRLALAEDGTMLVVPKAARADDCICVVRGLPMPLLLRRNKQQGNEMSPPGEFWELVGCCYAHGLMEGEALGMGRGLKTFILK